MRVGEDRLMIERQLHEADELVASGLRHIAEQNRIITELRESGRDTVAAELLRNTLLEAQALHREYREWLRHEFARIPAPHVRRTAQLQTTLFIALAVGWLLGRSHCPL
jgi:hypothetical protein